MTGTDFVALCFFLGCWFVFDGLVSGRFALIKRQSLTGAMLIHRKRWMQTALARDLRMIDTQILSGLQNGTAFFASTSIFAIGGCFALMGEADTAQVLFDDLPGLIPSTRAAFEMKACGLAAIFGYSFFKFGWSYRLFNYNTILFGGLPMGATAAEDRQTLARMAERVAEVNIIAARHFNTGLRAIFLSIGYLGWFLGPYFFMASTAFVFTILLRRQYFSDARKTILQATLSENGDAE